MACHVFLKKTGFGNRVLRRYVAVVASHSFTLKPYAAFPVGQYPFYLYSPIISIYNYLLPCLSAFYINRRFLFCIVNISLSPTHINCIV